MRKVLVLLFIFTVSALAQATITASYGQMFQGPQIDFVINDSGSGPYQLLFSRGAYGYQDAGNTGQFYGPSTAGAGNGAADAWVDFSSVVPPGSTVTLYVTLFAPHNTQYLLIYVWNPPAGVHLTSPANGSQLSGTTLNCTFDSPVYPAQGPAYVYIGTTPRGSDIVAGAAVGSNAFFTVPANQKLYMFVGTLIQPTYNPLNGGNATYVQYFYTFTPSSSGGGPAPGQPGSTVNSFTASATVTPAPASGFSTVTGQPVTVSGLEFSFTTTESGQGAGHSVYPSDNFSTVIRGAAPNSPVYMQANPVWGANGDGVAIGGDGTPAPNSSNYWCWTNPATSMYQVPNPPCQIGTTDSTGYFALPGYFGNIPIQPEIWSESWWVGSPVDQNLVGHTTYAVVGAGQPLQENYSIEVKRPSTGETMSFPAAGRIKVSEASATHAPGTNGKILYTFTLDTREGSLIRIGHNPNYRGNLRTSALDNPNLKDQNGWHSVLVGWVADQNSQRSPHSKFTLESDWLPGPVAIMMQGAPAMPAPIMGNSMDNAEIARATSIYNDSQRRTVIGPAIPPGADNAKLVLIIKSWIAKIPDMGFLAPLTREGADLKLELEKLKPSSPIQKSTVDCLKAVIQ